MEADQWLLPLPPPVKRFFTWSILALFFGSLAYRFAWSIAFLPCGLLAKSVSFLNPLGHRPGTR